MTNEIKEILDRLDKIVPYADVPKELAYMTTNITTQEVKALLDCITNLREEVKSANESITWWRNRFNALHKENELHNKILKDANDVLNIQAQEGNYNYDSYMLGLYNGMEMIVSLFEQREPKFKCGKDIKFLHERDYKEKINEVQNE